MSRSTGILLTRNPLNFILIALVATAAIVVPARVMAHTPEGGHPTSTSVACSDAQVLHGNTTNCVVTVTDLTADEAEVASPAGSVVIESNRDGDLGSCTLAATTDTAAACTIAVTGSPGLHALTARYQPVATELHTFAASEATATLTVVGGTIVIQKTTLGTTGTFSFTMTEAGADTTFSLGTTATGAAGAVSNTFGDLVPGTFTVVEAAAEGWSLTDLACTITADGAPQSGAIANVANRSATITVAAGETVTCRFENSRHGTINIVKDSGDADGTFAFNTTGGLAGGGLTITTSDGSGNVVTSLQPGTYTVTETAAEGWELASVECVASTGSSASVAGNTATINLAAAGTVTCIFVNEATEEDDEPVVEACGPAAPALAAAYLKSQGIKPGGPGRFNLVAAVATQLGGPRATFDGLTKCDEGYQAAVEAFLDAEIEAQGLGAEAEAEAGAASQADTHRGGPPPWAGGPPPWARGGR
jgi:hypothetical protein